MVRSSAPLRLYEFEVSVKYHSKKLSPRFICMRMHTRMHIVMDREYEMSGMEMDILRTWRRARGNLIRSSQNHQPSGMFTR